LVKKWQWYNSSESMRLENMSRKAGGHTLLYKVHTMKLQALRQSNSENNIFSLYEATEYKGYTVK